MRQSFRVNFSASTVQLFINQLFGLAVFYFASKGLAKNEFGELNWTLAVFLTVYAVLSFGIDQLIIKKIAAGENKDQLLSLHFFHALVAGSLFCALMAILLFVFPSFQNNHPLLLLLGAGKLLLFFSTPFKSIATGEERFRRVLYMSVPSSVLKGVCLCVLFFANRFSVAVVVGVFVVADASEFVVSYFLTRRMLRFSFSFFSNTKNYFALLKEAAPQLGVVIFSSALARVDWILIGIFLPVSKLAEYSFAYKAFELSSMPLLVIAPLLIPCFTRLTQRKKNVEERPNIQLLLRIEMMIACFAALCLNIVWHPLVDEITNGKYGGVNRQTVFLLSLCLPVLYVNNFLWTLLFARGQTKIILRSFVLCFVVNTVANLLLIPLWQNSGAAVSYLLALAAQTLYYSAYTKAANTLVRQSFALCLLCALCSGVVFTYSSLPVWWRLLFCAALYVLLLLCTVQLRRADWQIFKQALRT